MTKIGVLITNLGTPEFATKKAIKKYLREFLNDVRVVEPPPPKILWQLILHTIILNTRPQKLAKAYNKIWCSHGSGSPLLDISIKQCKLIQKSLGDNYQVELAMRYGSPSIKNALSNFNNCAKIIILPLYPQYSSPTTGSVFDAIADNIKQFRVIPELIFINNYYSHHLYIDALVQTIKQNLADDEFLIISYHGIPKRYFEQGDIYGCHCCQTTNLIVKKLQLTSNNFAMSYQSRFGKEEWMKPYTDEILINLAQKGIKKVKVVCPGFSSDCLETLEEVSIQYKSLFLNAGGESFGYIPALNYSKEHIKLLTDIIVVKS